MGVLAINGGIPAVSIPKPHFQWPPPIENLGTVVKKYIDTGKPLSIIDRTGVFKELEDKFCSLHERKHALVVSSGTMALYSAYFGLDLKPGDEVISTVYSFHATATPLLHLGVKIVFCDIEEDTGNINPDLITNLITDRTRAIVTNHMWGHSVDVSKIREICDKYGIAWIEDCSHAHFSEYNHAFVGTSGDASVFSLQGNKLLSGGEGGILLTDNTEIYERAVLLGHSLKRSEDCVLAPKWQEIKHTGFGLKLRMHPLSAVIILHILDNYCFDWIESRRETLAYFSDELVKKDLLKPMTQRKYVTSMGAHYGFKPKCDFDKIGVDRLKLVSALRAEGVKVSVPKSKPFHMLPLFTQRIYSRTGTADALENRRFPGAETYYNSILSLPTFSFSKDKELIDQYIQAFEKVFRNIKEIR